MSDRISQEDGPAPDGLEPQYGLAMGSSELIKAALTVLEREWGTYGYRAGVRVAGSGGVILEVEHSDGSRFHLWYRSNGSWGHQDVKRSGWDREGRRELEDAHAVRQDLPADVLEEVGRIVVRGVAS